jgi:Mrp family chromosome partitioning ATPase
LSAQVLDMTDAISGLGATLAGTGEPGRACHPTSLRNLYLLSSGPVRQDAAELLAGTRFPALLEESFRWFDRVVIDASAVLSASDALAIARYAERTCLVVRERRGNVRELRRAADMIRGAGGNLAGYVWNDLPWKAGAPTTSEPRVMVPRALLEAAVPATNEVSLPTGTGRVRLMRQRGVA